jgi:hypothetical protein
LRDPAERNNRRDQGETDGRVRKVDFSAYFSVSMMRGSSAPDGDQIASLVLRCSRRLGAALASTWVPEGFQTAKPEGRFATVDFSIPRAGQDEPLFPL